MVQFYLKLVKAGKKTLAQVPVKWQAAVKAALEAEEEEVAATEVELPE